MNASGPIRVITLGAGVAIAATGWAQSTSNSPFLPAAPAPSPASTPASISLELRGVMAAGEARRYYVYDSSKKSGVWAAVNEAEGSFVILSGDPSGNEVQIRLPDGRQFPLTLRDARISGTAAESVASATPDDNDGVTPVYQPAPTEAEKRWEAHRKAIAHIRFERARQLQAAAAAGVKN